RVAAGADEAPVAERRPEPLPAAHDEAAERLERRLEVAAELAPAGDLHLEDPLQPGLHPVGDDQEARWCGVVEDVHGRPDRRPCPAERGQRAPPPVGASSSSELGSRSATIWVTSIRAAVMRSRQMRRSSAARFTRAASTSTSTASSSI